MEIQKNNTDMSVKDVGYGASVNQANGNISNTYIQGLQITDVIPLVRDVVKSEIQIYTLEGNRVAEERLKIFAEKLEDEVTEKVKDKVYRFAEPAMQYATREATIGYIRSGDEEKGQVLLDLLIERIKENEQTSMQALIDEAIAIIPKLSHECLALITFMAYIRLNVTGSKYELTKWINCINPVLDTLPKISQIDKHFLVQTNCVSASHHISNSFSILEQFRKSYPLACVHPAPENMTESILSELGLEKVHEGWLFPQDNSDYNFTRMLISLLDLTKMHVVAPALLKHSDYEEAFKAHPEYNYMKDVIFELINNCKPMTDDEILNYIYSFNPNWKLALDMLNKQPLNLYNLNPVGLYIASRKLSKLYGTEVPLSIFFPE